MCDNRQQITKIVDVLAHKCPPSLNLIIDFLNKVTTEEITILLNLYMEKTLDLLPFETINNLVTYAVFTFSDKHVAVSPIKKRKFLISINMLMQRVDELESIENNRRKELRSNNNENGNGDDVVHYRFTLDLKNKKMRFNALIKAIDKVEYPKYVVTFINELIPRLNEEDKSVFIAQLCMYDDYVVTRFTIFTMTPYFRCYIYWSAFSCVYIRIICHALKISVIEFRKSKISNFGKQKTVN